jgi:predicted acyl esterase
MALLYLLPFIRDLTKNTLSLCNAHLTAAPYGKPSLKEHRSGETMMKSYIIVYQDVRGRWMSDGLYDNMRFYP